MLRPAFGPPQGEPEGATLAELRLHADGAAVQLDQAFREREAEARPFVAAALARVELHELLKQLSLIRRGDPDADRKSTRLNSSHRCISYAVFCLKKKNTTTRTPNAHPRHCLPGS